MIELLQKIKEGSRDAAEYIITAYLTLSAILLVVFVWLLGFA